MELEFVNITKENWDDCVALSVADEQKSFIASNLDSLNQAESEPEMRPIGICADGSMIGFIMYVKSTNESKVWIVRFMIDKAYQKMGYGREALSSLVLLLNERYSDSDIYLCVEPENDTAIKFYEHFNFLPTGDKWDNELVYRRTV